jgi:hypothetical protein
MKNGRGLSAGCHAVAPDSPIPVRPDPCFGALDLKDLDSPDLAIPLRLSLLIVAAGSWSNDGEGTGSPRVSVVTGDGGIGSASSRWLSAMAFPRSLVMVKVRMRRGWSQRAWGCDLRHRGVSSSGAERWPEVVQVPVCFGHRCRARFAKKSEEKSIRRCAKP